MKEPYYFINFSKQWNHWFKQIVVQAMIWNAVRGKMPKNTDFIGMLISGGEL